MARTIDHISDGRFIFGTGSGWFERDYDEYGYEFGTAGRRLDALADALPRIEQRWEKLNPPPVHDIPILIGGAGEKKTLRIVAQHADIWHSFTPPEDLPRKLGILAEHGAAVGRDVSEIEVSNELRNRDEATANALLEAGVTLFTLGITGPDYDLAPVRQWLRWRDERNS
jgi:alkanesulfonate monooxygenase SsuD/methylene tetrahydromethanopterin reductase-like flavin-dependent oxidoreductase (luciferase family)